MKGGKFISFFAVCGLLLSFLFGLFSHTSFISVLLKALIFGIIFGILGFCINIVFEKFLADDSAEYTSDSDIGSSGSEKMTGSSKGQLVDITIEDEELEKTDGTNHFVVGTNHQMLNETDVKSSNEVRSVTNDEKSGFVPLKNFETVNTISGKEAVSSKETKSFRNESSDSTNVSEEIDTLPDMDHLDFTSEDDSDDGIDTSTDCEFVSSANMHKANGESTEIKDAALMAKAISSVLSDENSL